MASAHDPANTPVRFEKPNDDRGEISDVDDRKCGVTGRHHAAGNEASNQVSHLGGGFAERRAGAGAENSARVHDRDRGTVGLKVASHLFARRRRSCVRHRSCVRNRRPADGMVGSQRCDPGLEKGAGTRDVNDGVEPELMGEAEHGTGAVAVPFDHQPVATTIPRHPGVAVDIGAVDNGVAGAQRGANRFAVVRVADHRLGNGDTERRHRLDQSVDAANEHDDAMAGGDERRGGVRPDVAGRPGHHHSHRLPPFYAAFITGRSSRAVVPTGDHTWYSPQGT